MKRIILLFLLFQACFITLKATADTAGSGDSIEVYLLTCDAGTEVYSIYGHSAIRISIPESGFDRVYNWGLFDFATPAFAWKFAKGRLDYSVGESSYKRFLDEYIYEQRAVHSQKINLNQKEKEELLALVNYNMMPENRLYRYDFFYDNCATRIRDIIENSVGNSIYYPDSDYNDAPTFRNKLDTAQEPLPWLNAGINLLIGLSGDKQMSYREQMFLPADLMDNLSLATVTHGSETVPLLQNPVMVLEFESKTKTNSYFGSPEFIFWLLLFAIVIISLYSKKQSLIRKVDILLFSVFSLLALLLIFFTFFTDHLAMKMNFNILWLNPLLIAGLVALFVKRCRTIWFKLLFTVTLFYIISIPFLPQSIDSTFLPLILLIGVRSYYNSGFDWHIVAAGDSGSVFD